MKFKIQNTYHESTLKTLEKSGKIYFIYTMLESGKRTKIDTVWEFHEFTTRSLKKLALARETWGFHIKFLVYFLFQGCVFACVVSVS